MDKIASNFKRAQTWSTDATDALRSGDRDRALTSLTSCTKSTTSLLLSLLLEEADMSNGLGRPAGTRAAAARAAAIAPTCARAHYWLGRAALKEDAPAEAAVAFAKAVAAEGDGNGRKEYTEWAAKAERRAGGARAPAARADDDDVGVTSVDVSGGGAPVVTVAEVPPPAAGATEGADKEYMPKPAPPPARPRFEWYQSPATVTVDVYAKGVDAAASVVEISETRLVVRLVRPGADGFEMERELFGRVDVGASSWSTTKFKVEIVMKKVEAGEWKALGSEGGDLSAAERARVAGQERVAAAEKGKKDWDGIAAKELEGEKDGDGPMALFQTIYKDADDNTKRAMMKSYQESNGKVLSTDWKDVGSRKVEYKEKD